MDAWIFFCFWTLLYEQKYCHSFSFCKLGEGGGSNTLNKVQWFYAHAGMFCSIKHEQNLYYFELQYFKSIKVTENCAIFILVNWRRGVEMQIHVIYIKVK